MKMSENREDVFSPSLKLRENCNIKLTTLSKIIFVYRISVTNLQRIILVYRPGQQHMLLSRAVEYC